MKRYGAQVSGRSISSLKHPTSRIHAMSFSKLSRSLLSRSGMNQDLRSAGRRKDSSSDKKRKLRPSRLGFQPLEERQLLSINPVLIVNTQNIAETLVNPGAPVASNDQT